MLPSVSHSQPENSRGLNEFIKEALLNACRECARPLVRLCLKHGISFQDLADALKSVFVESAKDDYLPEKSTSAARVAVLSGIPRAEVEALLDADSASTSLAALWNACVQVLSAWHSDPDFTGPYGIPMELPLKGTRGFEELAYRYGGDLSTDDIFSELVRAGCMARGKRGTVKVLRRTYLSGQVDPAVIGYAGKCLRSLGETLEFNLEKSDSKDKRFQRQVVSTLGVRASDLAAFNELLNEAGQKFLEDLDSWITEREKALRNLEKIPHEIPRVYPGVSVYAFFRPVPKAREASQQ